MAFNDIFHEDELEKPYNFPTNMLPLKHECLRYCLSRTRNKITTHTLAVRQLCVIVEKIWSNADCCPMTAFNMATAFEREPVLASVT